MDLHPDARCTAADRPQTCIKSIGRIYRGRVKMILAAEYISAEGVLPHAGWQGLSRVVDVVVDDKFSASSGDK
jgi:hypothetical protein